MIYRYLSHVSNRACHFEDMASLLLGDQEHLGDSATRPFWTFHAAQHGGIELSMALRFAFDHAFAIKGQGTVLTGTVLSGLVKPQMGIVVPQLGEAHQKTPLWELVRLVKGRK